MLALTDAFKAFLFTRQIRTPLVRMYFEKTGIDTDHGLKSFNLELTELVGYFGTITRELNIENGMFRPGGNTLILRNTKDLGDYLLSLRKRFGDQLWNDKTYHLFYGFKEFPTTASVAGCLPKMATLGFGSTPGTVQPTSSPSSLGFGDTPTGEPDVDSATEETVRVYSGDTQRVLYDRLNDTVELVSKDYYQRLVEFKLCKTIPASDIFTVDSGTADTRNVQPVLRYGSLKLITSDASARENRSSPFSAALCMPNIYAGGTPGGASGYASYGLWYLPCENELTITGYASGTLKFYYWDYMSRIWKAFSVGDYVHIYVRSEWLPGLNYAKGIYLCIAQPTERIVDGDTWEEYLAGDGAYYDNDKPDPAVCGETISALTNCNPARIIHDLLTSRRFMYINQYLTDLLDYYSFSSLKTSYSFDAAYDFFDGEGINLNVDISRETSVAQVVSEICGACGMDFYVSANKGVTSRRCIRLKISKVHNPCTEAPPALLTFSTKDCLIKYDTELNKDEKYDRVEIFGFNSSYSTKDSFENAIVGDGDNALTLGSSRVYFYDSYAGAQGIAERLYNKFINPTEIAKVTLDARGFIVELADYIKLHDHKLDEEIVVEVYRWAFDLKNKVDLIARRYTKLYGPDENNIYKKYAFCGCARAGTDAKFGDGFSAYISSGDKTVTLGVLESFDLNTVKVGMAIRISTAMFWIASITSTTELEVDTAATVDLSSEPWSIGNSYHAR
jgi:hypothetical protein